MDVLQLRRPISNLLNVCSLIVSLQITSLGIIWIQTERHKKTARAANFRGQTNEKKPIVGGVIDLDTAGNRNIREACWCPRSKLDRNLKQKNGMITTIYAMKALNLKRCKLSHAEEILAEYEKEKINHIIEKAILKAEEEGAKVLSLGHIEVNVACPQASMASSISGSSPT
ncbi:hypothetical protein Sjap_012766 [Stephania japonica]|uniref:Uncharacterized protein n=1 Tax=Stephania japonica TaxID=461633 RepID=A0AAP0IWR5_9MAGN